MKKGISLVALVITIIVLIILTGVVILTATNTNIFGKSEEAVFKNNVTTFQEELTKSILEKQLEDNTFNQSAINATSNGTGESSIATWIPSIVGTGYEDSFEIVCGKLVFTGTDTKQKEYVEKLGITASVSGGNSSTASASENPSSSDEGETNPWIEWGLTSSNVVFDRMYDSDGEERPYAFESIAIYSNGELYARNLVTYEQVSYMYNNEMAFVGEDYIFWKIAGDPSKEETDTYFLIVFNGANTARLYVAYSDEASFTKQSIIDNDRAATSGKAYTYTLSSGN